MNKCPINYHNIRMDCLTLGDIVAVANGFGEVSIEQVTSLELAGDDVTVNGWMTSSQGNTITVIWVEAT